MNKLTQTEMDALEQLRHLSGVPMEIINKVMLSTMVYLFMQYSCNEQITLPYFGQFLVRYEGEEETLEGTMARLSAFFSPSNSLKLNIGMFEDMKKGKCSIHDIPIFKYYEKDNERTLKAIMNEVEDEEEEFPYDY